MKNRIGFVSNSSSCSFCIGKNYMTEKQINSLRERIEEWDEESEDTNLFEGKLYFHGYISVHNTEIHEWLKENNLDQYADFQS